jgi:hypothetical protein
VRTAPQTEIADLVDLLQNLSPCIEACRLPRSHKLRERITSDTLRGPQIAKSETNKVETLLAPLVDNTIVFARDQRMLTCREQMR